MIYNLNIDNDKTTPLGNTNNGVDIQVQQMVKKPKGKSSTPLNLLGQGARSYGEDLQNNFYYLLENFYGNIEPSPPVIGMLWYDSGLDKLKLYTGKDYPNGPWMIVDFPAEPIVPSLTKKSLIWNDTKLRESNAYDGSVAGSIYVYPNENLKFKTTILPSYITVTNIPTGLKTKIENYTSTVYGKGWKISFDGKAIVSNASVKITIKVSPNAFEPSETNINTITDNSLATSIKFYPDIKLTADAELKHQFLNIQMLTLIENAKSYFIFYDILDGRYVCTDGSTITDFGSIFEKCNVLLTDYTTNKSPLTNQYEWISKKDKKSAYTIYKFSKNTVGSPVSKIVKLEIKSGKVSLSISETSVPLDDYSYIVNNSGNIGLIDNNSHIDKVYTVGNVLDVQQTRKNVNSDYTLIYNQSKYYKMNEYFSLFEFDTEDSICSLPYTNLAKYDDYLPLYKMSNNNSIHMYDVYKPVIQIVNYSTTVQVFEFDISAKFPTIPKINKIITNVATRIIDFVKGYWHICDIQYNGLQNAGTDLFHVIITNNLKDGAENYQLISLSIPHVCNKLDDILANVEPLFDTYKDSAHNIILNSVEKIEKNIFKFFYDVDNSYGGIIFNTPPMVVAINNPPEGDLIIKGSGKVGENLTLDSSTIKDLDGMGPLSYKWFIEGIKDPVSSGNNYTPVVGDVGKNIMAIAYYVDGKQNNEKVESSNIKIISKPWVVGSNDPSPYLTLKILKAGENYTDYPPVGLGDWHPITPGIYYHAVVDINNTSYTNYTWEYSVDGINWLWYYYFSVSPARAIWGQWSSPYIRCYVTDDTGQKLYSNNFLATGV